MCVAPASLWGRLYRVGGYPDHLGRFGSFCALPAITGDMSGVSAGVRLAPLEGAGPQLLGRRQRHMPRGGRAARVERLVARV